MTIEDTAVYASNALESLLDELPSDHPLVAPTRKLISRIDREFKLHTLSVPVE